MPENTEKFCHYFVDEAGDPTLFNRRGNVIIGSQGCSRFFILGLLQVGNPASLEIEFTALRKRLLADPYFSGVPSMQPKAKKTAIAFHAKDDLPEVRREVFSILMKRKDLKFFAIIKDKNQLLSYVRQRNTADSNYRYSPNELYDYLVRRLFRDRLHTSDQYQIHFAKRGSSDRTQSLKAALRAAQERFAEKYHQPDTDAPIEMIPAFSKDFPALQAVDYFLWSLQRLYERGEERYISLLWPSFRLVVDIDDTRFAQYGVYYNQKRPLNLTAFTERMIIMGD
jgi:hypothetical protein